MLAREKLKQENAEIRASMFRNLCYLLLAGATMWTIICLVLGIFTPALIPFGFLVFTWLNLRAMRKASHPGWHAFVQMLCSTLLPMLFQVALGGLAPSGMVMFWSFVPVVAILGYYRWRPALIWSVSLTVVMGGLILIDPGWNGEHFVTHDGNLNSLLLAINIGAVALVIFSTALAFVKVQGKSRRTMYDLQERLGLAHGEIAERNEHLERSMQYAQRIQQALLPEHIGADDIFGERFTFIQQKEKVGGDSIWQAEMGDFLVLAMIDCTGHGVPGSLLSVLVHELLTSGFNRSDVDGPAALIEFLYRRMESRLKITDGLWNDSAEIAVVEFNRATGAIRFAGTDMSLVLVNPDGVQRIRGSGTVFSLEDANARCMLNHTVELPPQCSGIYLHSDGITDQFNEHGMIRFGSSRLYALLGSMSHLSMELQQARFMEEMTTWQGGAAQTDDMSLMGLRLAPQFLMKARRQ